MLIFYGRSLVIVLCCCCRRWLLLFVVYHLSLSWFVGRFSILVFFCVCFQSYHLLLFVNGMLILKLLLPSFIQNSLFLNNSSALLSDSS